MKYVRNCEQCRRRKLKCDRIVPVSSDWEPEFRGR